MRVQNVHLAEFALLLALLAKSAIASPSPSPGISKYFKKSRSFFSKDGQCPAGTTPPTGPYNPDPQPVDGGYCPLGSTPADTNGKCPPNHRPLVCGQGLEQNQISKRDDDGQYI
ncbi:uncharacterized protein PgNI_09186 [Pyricularia grisea]|uniref:Uncharacterized protein n=1 Tax=Pyricularia grisea TaxID=148305 RepID=A0A6P8ATI0_PYRGI|nr:uncharacterized protein PgNI_09186 [Pyricularia grisea]TLD05439.1 hypothetical protein PgNI_09186 [Pyricularia grisea]